MYKRQSLSGSLMVIIRETASINNFWDKKAEQKTAEGKIEDEIRYSGIKELSDQASLLSSELMKLAKNRLMDLR